MQKTRFRTAKKRRNGKAIALAVTVTLVVASLAGGAMAWTDFSQSRTNKFHGSFEADVTLHDEFDGEDKDVFVENTGTNTLYVRVRLDEFMLVGGTQFDPQADIYNKTTWNPHTYTQDNMEECEPAENGDYHDHYKWTMSGAQRLYKPGTPGMVYTQLGADGKVDTTSGALLTATEAPPVLLSDVSEAVLALQAGSLLSPEQETLLAAVEGGCWVLDNTDTAENGGGWAYWSRGLQPMSFNPDGSVNTYGEATNLLLDKVELVKEPESDWIYRIDVKLQAVTLGDTGLWHDDASDCGYKLTDAANTLIEHWNA